VNPFFFGRSERPLYGCYHAPKADMRPAGAVICPPIGQEYMRTHRALRQLALQLNKGGAHALRFDYCGIGDSAGDNTDATLDAWLADIGSAIDELKDTAGLKQVSLVGIRLGASLAGLAAAGRTDIDAVVLWDPVVNGRDYVAELFSLEGGSPQGHAGAVGVSGFALTPAFRRQIEAIDLLAPTAGGPRRIFQIASEERPEYLRLRDHLQANPAFIGYACIPSGGSWVDLEQMGAMLLPQAIIQHTVKSLQ
jgi:uncharacterized protein